MYPVSVTGMIKIRYKMLLLSPCDALFSSISKISMRIDNARVLDFYH